MGHQQSSMKQCLSFCPRFGRSRQAWWEELDVLEEGGLRSTAHDDDEDNDEEIHRIASQRREASSLRNMGRSFHVAGSFDKAVEYYDKELELRTALGDTVGACEVWLELGTALRARGNTSASISAFESCVTLVCEAQEPQLAYQALCQLASLHRSLGDNEAAINSVEKCLALAESLDDAEGIAFACNHLGNIHQAMGDYKTALTFHLRANAPSEDDVSEGNAGVGENVGSRSLNMGAGGGYEGMGNIDGSAYVASAADEMAMDYDDDNLEGDSFVSPVRERKPSISAAEDGDAHRSPAAL